MADPPHVTTEHPYDVIRYVAADGVLTLTLHRPDQRNALTPTMVLELADAFGRADRDDDVRAIVVTGSGNAFCVGADLSAGGSTFDLDSRGFADATESPRDGGGLVALSIFNCRKPVIAAINGPAVGVGITMTLPMDIRLAATSARFGFVFARRGITPEACSSWFLPRIVGISQAAEWLYTGRVFDASEALAGGLVRSVHEPDKLLPTALALAQEIADTGAPVAVALARQLLWRGLASDHPALAHSAESQALHVLGRSPDAYEGVMSFVEKRPPVFTGRVSTDLPDVFSAHPSWLDDLLG